MDHEIDYQSHIRESQTNSHLNTVQDNIENSDGLDGRIISNGAAINLSQHKGKKKTNKKSSEKHPRQLSQAQRQAKNSLLSKNNSTTNGRIAKDKIN